MADLSTVNIGDFFKEQSHLVWKRIEFARKLNLRIRETTITEELLFRFWRAYYDKKIPIRIFEAKAEHKNGNDLEIFVKTSRGFILLVCQAKITDNKGGYRYFFHKVSGKFQIKLLSDYARKRGAIAQYLLFNYVHIFSRSAELLDIAAIEDFGITTFSADLLLPFLDMLKMTKKSIPVPNFAMLHPGIAIPFHQLVCSLLGDRMTVETDTEKITPAPLKFYSEEEVVSEEDWWWLQKPPTIGFITKEDTVAAPKQADKKEEVFSPKYRLVIGGEFSRGQLRQLS